MPWIQPLNNFLCCFSLGAGVKLLLALHLWEAVFCSSFAITNLVSVDGSLSYGTSDAVQLFSASWSMLGVPFVLLGLYGVYHRMERHVRSYLYYLIASCLMDVVHLVNIFLVQDACVHLPGEMLATGGKSFACGVARSLSGLSVAALGGGLVYMTWVVWSYCEDLADTGSAGVIQKLLGEAHGAHTRTTRIRAEQLERESEPSILVETVESIGNGALIVYGALLSGSVVVAMKAGEATTELFHQIDDFSGGRVHHQHHEEYVP